MNYSEKITIVKDKANLNELQLLTIPEACKLLCIGHWAVYQQINRHKLKTVKIGKRRLISIRAIDEFISGQERYGA